jgi:hypothetical protein
MLSVAREGGEVTLYDAATMQKRGEYVFPARPRYVRFSKDGSRMLALLKNQMVYVLEVDNRAAAQKWPAGLLKCFPARQAGFCPPIP